MNFIIIFDSELILNPHVQHLVKTGFDHLYMVREESCLFFSWVNMEMLMHAFIASTTVMSCCLFLPSELGCVDED